MLDAQKSQQRHVALLDRATHLAGRDDPDRHHRRAHHRVGLWAQIPVGHVQGKAQAFGLTTSGAAERYASSRLVRTLRRSLMG